MRFGLLYEMEMPRPWNERSEYNIYWQALEQIELGDRLGFDFVWEVEHHFLEEYSHSSAPEVFLGAVSQRTKQRRRPSERINHGPLGSDETLALMMPTTLMDDGAHETAGQHTGAPGIGCPAPHSPSLRRSDFVIQPQWRNSKDGRER